MMRKLLFGLMLVTMQTALCEPIERYIESAWDTLTRTHADLAQAAEDPKLGERSVYLVYVPRSEDLEQVRSQVQQAMDPDEWRKIELRPLPEGPITEHGLLYLPHPYVVPGGRFNEMYGWDSHFIVLGLLKAGRVDLARQMVDNHLYQVEHYGAVLNANRTYYLTRSQPPFLCQSVAAVYQHTQELGWLKKAWPTLIKHYTFWTTEPHLTPETGLSRYFDQGQGPAPEVLAGERDESGQTHYDRIAAALLDQGSDGFPLELYLNRGKMTALFYKGDRSMRESGFDPSDRFGSFNLDVTFFNPVELNCLLFESEQTMATLASELGLGLEQERLWTSRALHRKRLIHRYLWDQDRGLFLDYNLRTNSRRDYPFATTFFPLWTGVATPAQAERITDNLTLFERDGGIVTSTRRTGNQWDSPFGWAPLQLAAVAGLERYGYHQLADRIADKFLSLVEQEYSKSGFLVEKYDVVERSSRVSKGIHYGYSSNEIGFGWTNAVYLLLRNRAAL